MCFWFGGAHILHNLSNLCNCNTAMTMTMTMTSTMAMAIEPPDDSDKQDSTSTHRGVTDRVSEGGGGGQDKPAAL